MKLDRAWFVSISKAVAPQHISYSSVVTDLVGLAALRTRENSTFILSNYLLHQQTFARPTTYHTKMMTLDELFAAPVAGVTPFEGGTCLLEGIREHLDTVATEAEVSTPPKLEVARAAAAVDRVLGDYQGQLTANMTGGQIHDVLEFAFRGAKRAWKAGVQSPALQAPTTTAGPPSDMADASHQEKMNAATKAAHIARRRVSLRAHRALGRFQYDFNELIMACGITQMNRMNYDERTLAAAADLLTKFAVFGADRTMMVLRDALRKFEEKLAEAKLEIECADGEEECSLIVEKFAVDVESLGTSLQGEINLIDGAFSWAQELASKAGRLGTLRRDPAARLEEFPNAPLLIE